MFGKREGLRVGKGARVTGGEKREWLRVRENSKLWVEKMGERIRVMGVKKEKS